MDLITENGKGFIRIVYKDIANKGFNSGMKGETVYTGFYLIF
jgi:hypothetical protein